MPVDATTVNARCEAAITAIDSGDWTTAKTNLLAAKAALVALPDGRQGPDEVSWDRKAIDSLIDECDSHIAASTGMQRSPVRYVPG